MDNKSGLKRKVKDDSLQLPTKEKYLKFSKPESISSGSSSSTVSKAQTFSALAANRPSSDISSSGSSEQTQSKLSSALQALATNVNLDQVVATHGTSKTANLSLKKDKSSEAIEDNKQKFRKLVEFLPKQLAVELQCQTISFDKSAGLEECIEISRIKYDLGPPDAVVPIKSRRIIISSDGTMSVEIMGKVVKTKPLADCWIDVVLEEAKILTDDFVPCFGIAESIYDLNIQANMDDSTIKNILFDSYPVKCYRSLECGRIISDYGRHSNQCCRACRLAISNLQRANKRRNSPSSIYCNLRYLPADEQLKRRKYQHNKIYRQRVQVQSMQEKLNDYDLELSNAQKQDMTNIIGIIQTKLPSELESVIKDNAVTTEQCCFEEVMRTAWKRDQLKNRHGFKGNRFSVVTYRLALAVYARSKKAYDILSSFPLLQLPSVRSLEEIVRKNYVAGQGPSEKQLILESKAYDEIQLGKLKPGKKVGALLFDEIKVVGKVYWNSKNHQFYGLAASADELKSLSDVFHEITCAGSKPAEYALQFVWRDLTSNYDVLGPYWFASKTLETKFLWSCVYESLRVFHAVGFSVIALVCDGATYNMRLLKLLCGHCGAAFGLGSDPKSEDEFCVPSSFQNPFQPDNKIFVVPCPSHGLKNFINALFSSQQGKTKAFRLRPKHPIFGWNAILELWDREIQRRTTRSRLVPKLLQSYVIRDEWTKLSVLPAKIMQQEQVLAELEYHLKTNPVNRVEIEDTLSFLKCCNNLFENGLLSHEKVMSSQSQPVLRVYQALNFLKDWYLALTTSGNFKPNSNSERRFLAYQTWDFIRMAIFGFCGLVEEFTSRFPGYYLIPFRVNGSGIESVFSQVRQRVGGQAVSSVNYSSGLSKLKISSNVDYNMRKREIDCYREYILYFNTKSKK